MFTCVLYTKRLQLTPFDSPDLELLYQTFTHPFVREYLWDDEIISREQTREIIEKNQYHFDQDGWGLWKIIVKENKVCAGFTGLWYFFDENQPQLLYGLLPQYTKKGFATEASGAVINYAFKSLGFPYLMASCDSPHTASKKVAERLGMAFIEEKEMNKKPTSFFRLESR